MSSGQCNGNMCIIWKSLRVRVFPCLAVSCRGMAYCQQCENSGRKTTVNSGWSCLITLAVMRLSHWVHTVYKSFLRLWDTNCSSFAARSQHGFFSNLPNHGKGPEKGEATNQEGPAPRLQHARHTDKNNRVHTFYKSFYNHDFIFLKLVHGMYMGTTFT